MYTKPIGVDLGGQVHSLAQQDASRSLRLRNPEEPVRIGLVGCGLVALAVHLRNLPRIASVKLASIGEADDRRRARAAELAPGHTIHSSYRDVLMDPSVDAVIISVPYEQHAAIASDALDAGKHVYLEKPFTTSVEDARNLIQRWRLSGLVGMLGFNYRLHPHIAAMKAAIVSGKIGKVISIQTAFAFAPHAGVDWDVTRHGQFGALFDLAPHHIDLARYFTGAEVTSASAEVRSLKAEADTASLRLQMSDGVFVHSFLSTNCVEDHRFTIHGSDGMLATDLYRRAGPLSAGKKAAARRWTEKLEESFLPMVHAGYVAEKLRSPWQEPSFLRSILCFLDSVRGLSCPALPSFEDGYRSQLVIEAALHSIATGQFAEVAAT